MKAGAGVTLSPAKEPQEPPEGEEAGRVLPGALRGRVARPHLDFKLQTSGLWPLTWGQNEFLLF